MKKSDVIEITMEKVPLGVSVYCRDEGIQKKLLYAYHSEGWHLSSARKRAVEGVFYQDDHLSDIVEIICPEQWMVERMQKALSDDGMLIIRLQAELAFPLLGLRQYHRSLK